VFLRAFTIASCVVTVLLVGIGIAYIWVPEWLTNQLRFKDPSEYYVFLASTRSSLATLLGTFVTSLSALAAILTVYAAYRSYIAAQDKQASEVIARATELLGSEATPLRLGGIHALRRLASSSFGDHPAAIAILTGFLRFKYGQSSNEADCVANTGGLCPADAQAILETIGERLWKNSERGAPYDVSNVTLTNASLRGDWSGVVFQNVTLRRADFTASNLSHADFTGAHLIECRFRNANLAHACLAGAIIEHPADLKQAQIDLADGSVNTVLPGDLQYPQAWSP
jgi:hypothetical protein